MNALIGLMGSFILSVGAVAGNAGDPGPISSDQISNPLLVTVAANKCSHLVRQGGRETLINSCNTCRVVGVIRKRPGIGIPVRREFNVEAFSKFPVPFRGPGTSRITSDVLCRGQQKNTVQTTTGAVPANGCVALQARKQGAVVLVNSCGTCRGVAVQRLTSTGRSMGLQAYKLFPDAVVNVDPKGAARAIIAGEVACPG